MAGELAEKFKSPYRSIWQCGDALSRGTQAAARLEPTRERLYVLLKHDGYFCHIIGRAIFFFLSSFILHVTGQARPEHGWLQGGTMKAKFGTKLP